MLGILLLTFYPLVDRVLVRACQIRVGIFPIDLHGVLLVDKHSIGDGAGWAPTVASNSAMAIHVVEFTLMLPRLVSVTPAELLEGAFVRSVPHVHTDLVRVRGIAVRCILARKRRVCVVAIAVVVAVVACLHPYLVRVVYFQIQLVDWAVRPDSASVALTSLPEYVIRVHIYGGLALPQDIQ